MKTNATQAIAEKRMPELAAEPCLMRAWDVVGRHGNTPGIDHVTVENFSQRCNEEIRRLHQDLLSDTYEPQPLITFPKMKKDHTFRELTIATVRDRVAARAAADYLNFHYDRSMAPNSYAYRPHRGALKAVGVAQKACRKAHYAARVDIDDFFDSIDHTILEERLESFGVAKDVQGLLWKFVSNRRFDGVRVSRPELGVPQGSPVAPILANLFLDELDRAVIDEGYAYLRYADDLVVFADSAEEAGNAMSLITYTLGQMGLQPDVNKSRVYSLDEGFLFLGFIFNRQGHIASSEARRHLHEKLGSAAYADETDAEFRKRQDAIVRGWKNYFEHEEKSSRADGAVAECPAIDVKAEECVETVADKSVDAAGCGADEVAGSENPVGNKAKADVTALLEETFERVDSFERQGRWGAAQQALRRLLNRDDEAALGSAQQGQVLARLADMYEKNGMFGPAARCRGGKGGVSEHTEASAYGKNDVECWLDVFGYRQGTLYKQYIDRMGRNGYRPSSSGFNSRALVDHWSGKHTLAVPVYDGENKVRFGVIDLDVSRAAVDAANVSEMEVYRSSLLDDARGLLGLAEKAGVKGVIEDSGYKGYHVWFIFHVRLASDLVVRFLKELVRVAGDAPKGCHRELFPGSVKCPQDGLHSRIKLPLGIHRVSGRRSCFVDGEGHAYDHGPALLACSNRNKAGSLKNALERWSRYTKKGAEVGDACGPQTGMSVSHCISGKGAAADDAWIDKLFRRCAVLRYLKEKAAQEGTLSHAERCIVRGILEPLGPEGVREIHAVLKNCSNYSHRQTEAFLGRGVVKPMGCRRIREILGAVADEVGCDCSFKPRKNEYANPLRHLNIKKTSASGTKSANKKAVRQRMQKVEADVGDTGGNTGSDDVQDLIRSYSRTRRALLEIQGKLLARLGDAASVQTELGMLRGEGHDPELRYWRVEL